MTRPCWTNYIQPCSQVLWAFLDDLFMHKWVALVRENLLLTIMKKIINSVLLALVPFLFSSCIDESTPTAVATVDSTSAAEVFGGYTLDLNPTIVFAADGLTGTYDNSANDSGFPAGTNIQVVIKYVDGGVGLDITFTADAFTDGALGVTVQDFKDTGNDGGWLVLSQAGGGHDRKQVGREATENGRDQQCPDPLQGQRMTTMEGAVATLAMVVVHGLQLSAPLAADQTLGAGGQPAAGSNGLLQIAKQPLLQANGIHASDGDKQ